MAGCYPLAIPEETGLRSIWSRFWSSGGAVSVSGIGHPPSAIVRAMRSPSRILRRIGLDANYGAALLGCTDAPGQRPS